MALTPEVRLSFLFVGERGVRVRRPWRISKVDNPSTCAWLLLVLQLNASELKFLHVVCALRLN